MKIKFIFFSLVFLLLVKALAEKNPFVKIPVIEAQKALDFHNKVRAEVGTKPLKLSAKLAEYAQTWADNLAENNNCQIKHRPHDGVWKQQYGENIFWGKGNQAEYTPLIASVNWYNEIENYKYELLRVDNLAEVGHYTQMIWHNTTEVGFGLAKCKNGAIIIVANYNPPGNYIDEKPY